MMLSYPDWWARAEPELHEALHGFAGNIQAKLQADAWEIIKRKNPYLFRIRAGNSANELATQIVNAFLSSSEETIFGDVLEDLAIIISKYARNGQKSSSKGIDLEYTDADGTRTLVQIKSGVNWGNSSQHAALVEDFNQATKILRQGSRLNVRCIEGCCYGPTQTTDRGTHLRIVGDDFWEEISGWREAGYALLDVLAEHAENGLQELKDRARDSILDFLEEQGVIDGNTVIWDNLLFLVTHSKPRTNRKSKESE